VAGAATNVFVGWLPQAPPWLAATTAGGGRGVTVMAGYGVGAAVRDGRLRYLPTPLSAVPGVLARLGPDVVVVPGVRRGRELVFGRSVGWGAAAAAQAPGVVVEIDDHAEDLGGPPIPGHIVRVVEAGRLLVPPPPARLTEIDRAIAHHVLSVLPEGATVQFGPGSLADAIVRSIDRPVSVASGLLTDAVAVLADRGLLDGVAVGGYVWGGEPIVRLCQQGGVRLAPVGETHAAHRLASITRFVAINTALQVGLDGSINVEQVGGRLVAGVGGHPDFCAGAARSTEGLSVIAVRSSYGAASTIVAQVERVSTPRYDVDMVVTEHGVADLRGCDDAQRGERLIEIASPVHRAELAASRP
jgi:acyl-CoA hydrolase